MPWLLFYSLQLFALLATFPTMASLPDSLLSDQSSSPGGRGSPTTPGSTRPSEGDPSRRVSLEHLILDLHDNHTRENALQRLSKIREIREDLAPLLWHSFGTPFSLLKEILEVYPLIGTPNLTQEASNRACSTLSLFQCIAAHPETRQPFIRANIPMYIYPLLNNDSKEKPHEYLRLSSLGVIGALVKDNDEDMVEFLLQTEVFCYCMRCIEVGTVLSRTVATFIIKRILVSDRGLKYCCSFADRFCVITQILTKMLDEILEEPSHRLLKLIIHCFLMLSEGPSRECVESIHLCLPKSLRDPKVVNLVFEDPVAMAYLKRLYHNVTTRKPPSAPSDGDIKGHIVKG